jgi:APA family basic amino acid/polyamine antiporter
VTWARFGVWLAAGLLIYALYGRRHSRLQKGEDTVRAPETDRLF